MAMEQDATTRLIYDARLAKEGADQFKQASQQVVGDNRAVEEAEKKTAQTVEQSEAKKVAAWRGGAAGARTAAKAQAVAAADAADVVANSTDRTLIPRLARQQQMIDSALSRVDPFARKVRLAQRDVENLQTVISAGGELEPNARAALPAVAGQLARLRAAQGNATRIAAGASTAAEIEGFAAPVGAVAPTAAAVAPIVVGTLQALATGTGRSQLGGVIRNFEAVAKSSAAGQTGISAGDVDVAAFNKSRQPAGQVNVDEWLKARKPPNEVNVEAWNKARQGPESFSDSLKKLFGVARSGSGDLHAAAGAAEELAGAHGHATGAAGRMREGLVLVHEFIRGDWRRAVGSATIELQRFGALELLFNPVVLGLGAIVGVMAEAAYKASEIEANLRSFSATVKVMGVGSLTSAADLQKFTEELKHTGVAGDAAKKTIDEISRSGFVKPGQSTEQFALLARDIAQYNGAGAAGTPAAAEELLKAFGGGADQAVKFAESLHALSAQQIVEIHYLDQHGRSAEALRKVYEALRAAIPPFTGDLSEIQKAFLDIKTAWDEFITSLANSEFPSLLTAGVKYIIGELKQDIANIVWAAHAIGSVKAAITGEATTPGGISREQIAPEYGPGSGNPEPYAAAPLPKRAVVVPTQQQIGNFLTGPLGFTPSQSAALIGQAAQESYFRPDAGLGTAHQGMFQLDAERWGQLQAWAQLNGLNPLDYRVQLQFAKKEIQARAPEFFSAGSLPEQTSILTKKFEVPVNPNATDPASVARMNAEIQTRLHFAEQALGTTTTPFHAPEGQLAQIDIANQKLKDQIAILSHIPGVEREAAQERQRLQEEAAKIPLGDQQKFIHDQMIGFWQKLAAQFEAQHRLNEQQISDTEKIARGYQQSAVEGLRAETLVQAQQQVRERGGDVATAQRDIINQRAAAAISASRQQSTLAEPGIAAAEALARASYVSRAEEEKTRVANEAAAQTQNVLNLALLQGSDAYIKEATAIDGNARAQIRRRDAAAQGLEAGHQIAANRDQSEILARELALQGQSSDVIRVQVDLLRARQEIEQRYTALTQGQRDAIYASTAAVVLQNATLEDAQRATQRLNDAFQSIASTIGGELTNSIRNALIRTPQEAGEHMRHYWDDFRAGLKSTLGNIASQIAELTLIRPLAGSIAGALGLGQAAQQLGHFAAGGAITVGGSGGTDSQHVQFMATPGERVYVLTPAQQAAAHEAGAMPRFAGGGEYDPATQETVYYNDAGQPFSVPQYGPPTPPEMAGISLQDLLRWSSLEPPAPAPEKAAPGFLEAGANFARAGLKTEAGFLSAAAADQPLLGLDTGTGEITGRIPALADFLQQGLVGGAPAGTLSAGMKVPGRGGLLNPLPVPADYEAELNRLLSRTEGVAQPKNAALQLAPGVSVGDVNLDQWLERVEKHLTPEEITEARRWYKDALPAYQQYFGEELAPHMMGAWMTGNVNAKPSFAQLSATRTLEQLRNRTPEVSPQKLGGLAHDALTEYWQSILSGNPEGLSGAGSSRKIYDFIVLEPAIRESIDRHLSSSIGQPIGAEGRAAEGVIPSQDVPLAAGPPPLGSDDQTNQPASGGFFNGLPMLATGGAVEQTGAALVHAGEVVLPTEDLIAPLRNVTQGLQGFATALGQTTPDLHALSRAARGLNELSGIYSTAQGLGSLLAPGGVSGARAQNGQLALNISGLSNGASVFGATQGGSVFQSGNTVSINGLIAATGGAVASQQPNAVSDTGALTDAALAALAAGDTSVLASSGTPAATAAGTAGPTVVVVPGQTASSSGSLAPQESLPAAAQGAAATPPPASTTAPAASPAGLSSISNLSSVISLANTLSGGGLFGSAGAGGGLFSNIGDFINNSIGTSLGFAASPVTSVLPNAVGDIGTLSDAQISALAAADTASGGVGGGLFGSATLTSALGGVGAGFAAGSLLNSLLGGNQLTGTIGSGLGAVAGSIVGSVLLPGIGTLLGGILGGGGGGILGGLFGGSNPGKSAGVVISPSGAFQTNTVGGSAANISTSQQVGGQIAQFVVALNQLTNAQGQPIGTNNATAVVSSDNNSGITVTGSGIAGGKFGTNAAEAVQETELQIIQALTNVSGTLKTVLANINDPSQLQAAVQFADVYDKLNVTSQQLTASLAGNVDVIGPFSQALTTINQTFSQLTAQAAQFGVDSTPITTALATVTATLKQDFGTALDEAFTKAMTGGSDFIAQLVQVHQAYEQNISDAAALGQTGSATQNKISGIEALQAGPTLAALGTDQLQTIIADLAAIAPELATMAQSLLASGKALPDIITQDAEAITNAGLLAVQKALALGYEQVSAATASGQNVGAAQNLATLEAQQAAAQATGTSVPTPGVAGGLPDLATQLLQSIVDPLSLAIEKERAAGAQRVAVAEAAGANLVKVEQANADSIQQIWYNATQSLVALKNSITGGTLSGLIAADQVTASIQQFNQILALVQGGNTNFLNELASAGQAAVEAAQTAYGNGPQTASVRAQILSAIAPLLVSSTGYPTGTGTTGATGGAGASASSGAASTGAALNYAAYAASIGGTTTNPATGASLGTSSGITAVVVNYPTYPSSTTLRAALADAIAGNPTADDFTAINEAIQAGILDPNSQPGLALVIAEAETWAAGRSVNPGALLSQALSDALTGTPTLAEWALINEAVDAGILSPSVQPQYSTVINAARTIANAQATSLSQIPDNVTAYNTTINGRPAFAGGSGGTPPGPILVGERGPEWMLSAGGQWAQVGRAGPEIIDQPGGAVILPFPLGPDRAFASGTSSNTIGPLDIAGQVPGIGSVISEAAGGPSLLDAAGGALGISSDALSTLGDVLPIAGPLIGGLLGLVTGGNVAHSAIGAAASLIGFAVGGPIGGLIGGLVGLIANLFGPPPSNNASGDLVDLATGAISDVRSAGDKKADAIVQGISDGIAASSLILQDATGGTISGAVSVQDGRRDGIKTSYSGPLGTIDEKWGDADTAISQFALAIAHNLEDIDPALQAALAQVSDPNQLLPVIQAYVAAQTPAAAATASTAAQPATPPAPPQLYSISQAEGPSYVGSLTTADVAWWENAGATLTPYTGAAVTARPGASLYEIQSAGIGGPSYVGDLTAADMAWWQNAGATLTPYGQLPAPLPGASLYFITQPVGPSYLADLTPPNLAWWQNTDATIAPSDGSTLPTPRQGAALYEITQHGIGPWYIGDLKPADAQWWENQGATVTPFAATADTVGSTASRTPYAGPGFAAGTPFGRGTPPGPILVGERGPEWMLGGANVVPISAHPNYPGWSLVGQSGPEVIDQPGGATILPHGMSPDDLPGFAAGTMPQLPAIEMPALGSGGAGGAVLSELQKMRAELAAFRMASVAGDQQAMQDAQTGHTIAREISRNTGPGFVAPERRKLA
jgi:hypothetical protein